MKFESLYNKIGTLFVICAMAFMPTLCFAGGTVKGRILWDGDIPVAQMIKVPADKHADCHGGANEILKNNLVVAKDGAVKNYVVSLSVKGKKPEAKEAVFDQKGCMFLSPVLVVPEGSTITMKNSDPGSHNVRTTCVFNKPVNVVLAAGETNKYAVTKKETIQVNCDIHPWMVAHIRVVNTNIFTLTNEKGEFELKDVPAGEYRFKAWHPILGSAKKKDQAPKTVIVEDGKTIEIVIKKMPKKKK